MSHVQHIDLSGPTATCIMHRIEHLVSQGCVMCLFTYDNTDMTRYCYCGNEATRADFICDYHHNNPDPNTDKSRTLAPTLTWEKVHAMRRTFNS